jgi:GDP-mannose transporter
MFYNNLLTVPVLLIASIVVEDWSAANLAKCFPPEQRNKVIFTMLLSGVSSVFISYSSAWCIRVTSSTTYSMVGALNKLPIAISGLIFFDAPATFGSIAAISVGFISGLVYAFAKLQQGREKEKEKGLPVVNAPVVSASSRSTTEGLR